jgi:Transposase
MNPERLTDRHQQKLARVQEINKHLCRAYLLCQQLQIIYRVPTSTRSSCSTHG